MPYPHYHHAHPFKPGKPEPPMPKSEHAIITHGDVHADAGPAHTDICVNLKHEPHSYHTSKGAMGQVYIGARYVPIFADPIEWDSERMYEPLTIVTYEGNTYTSKTFVPKGIDINDTSFWALTYNGDARTAILEEELEDLEKKVENYYEELNTYITVVDNREQNHYNEITVKLGDITEIEENHYNELWEIIHNLEQSVNENFITVEQNITEIHQEINEFHDEYNTFVEETTQHFINVEQTIEEHYEEYQTFVNETYQTFVEETTQHFETVEQTIEEHYEEYTTFVEETYQTFVEETHQHFITVEQTIEDNYEELSGEISDLDTKVEQYYTEVDGRVTYLEENALTSITGTSPINITEGENTANVSIDTTTKDGLGAVQVGDNITVSSGVISVTHDNVCDALGYTPLEAAIASVKGTSPITASTDSSNNVTVGINTTTKSQLGAVQVGDNINVSSGTISINATNVNDALGYTAASETEIANIWTAINNIISKVAGTNSVNESTGAITWGLNGNIAIGNINIFSAAVTEDNLDTNADTSSIAAIRTRTGVNNNDLWME